MLTEFSIIVIVISKPLSFVLVWAVSTRFHISGIFFSSITALYMKMIFSKTGGGGGGGWVWRGGRATVKYQKYFPLPFLQTLSCGINILSTLLHPGHGFLLLHPVAVSRTLSLVIWSG